MLPSVFALTVRPGGFCTFQLAPSELVTSKELWFGHTVLKEKLLMEEEVN